MKLSLEDIKKITKGAVSVFEEDGAFILRRMTDEQVKFYDNLEPEWGLKARSTAGIKFRFKTNSETLKIKVNVKPYNYVKYFCFDLFVNGEYKDSLLNFDKEDIPYFYPTCASFRTGDFEKEFSLGTGDKTVCLYMPWCHNIKIYEVELSSGAYIEPYDYSGNVLTYGDSITQGYYSLSPSKRYASQLAEMLDLEEFCMAIGAERFNPDFAKIKCGILPNLITVAYGTNDWGTRDYATVKETAEKFIETLVSNYKGVKIVVLSPIWRADASEEKPFGSFDKIYPLLKEIADKYENVYAINGRNFLPEDTNLYVDYRLHPDDKGFDKYFESLKQEIVKVL